MRDAKGCHLLPVFVRNAASRPVPLQEIGDHVGRWVDGSPPTSARRARDAPAMIVYRPLSGAYHRMGQSGRVSGPPGVFWTGVSHGLREMVRKCDQTGGSDGQRLADDHSRCFADPLGQSLRRSIDPAPHANPRDGAGRDGVRTNKKSPFTQTFWLESKKSNHGFP